MKLVNMKIDKAARQETHASKSALMDAPAYPYGLEVRLDKETLEKLGLTDKLPKVGTSLTLTALVDVTSVSENESTDGGTNCSVSLQITDLALATAKDAGDELYGKEKK